jgi:hypothetical protein
MALFGILKYGDLGEIDDSSVGIVFSTPLTISSNQPILAADTISLKRKTMGQRAQRWEIVTNVCPTVGSNEYLLQSVINGHDKSFRVRMPQIPNSKYSNAVLSVLVEALKGGVDIFYTPETTGDLIAGEFINFANHKKVYLVTSVDQEANAITIFPPLLANVDAGELISHGDSTILHVKNETSTVLGMTFVDGLLMDPGTITLIEDLAGYDDEG